jgi:hemerythrin
MPVVEWNDSFRIGVKQFDEHHKHLVSLLNKTYDAFVNAAPVEEYNAILNELCDYASYHFMEEELWMSIKSYPKAGPHIEEHNYFIRRLQKIRQDYRQGNSGLSLEIMTFLSTWLAEHILKIDADYGRFLSSQEVSF